MSSDYGVVGGGRGERRPKEGATSGDYGVAGGAGGRGGGTEARRSAGKLPSPSSSSSLQQLMQPSPSPAHAHSYHHHQQQHQQQHRHHHHHQQQQQPQEQESEDSLVPVAYRLAGLQHDPEDIIICVDVDAQLDADMKVTGSKGHTLSRLDAIKQAIFLFVYSKLSMHPLHRFAFAALAHSTSWLQQSFTSDIEVINNTVRNLCSSGTYPQCDLSLLFQNATSLARRSQAHGRILRVVLIYCRSDVVPAYPREWPQTQSFFTFDALYLHDKPSQQNCPQKVYDALVEALEKVSVAEGYIYESGSGSTRILFKQMCCLMAHPQQRCGQDDFEVPRDISKVMASVTEGNASMALSKEDDAGAGASKAFT